MRPIDKVEIVDERGVLHYLEPDSHRSLVAAGLIWRVGDAWHMRAETGDQGQFPDLAVCDFCNLRPVAWEVDADAFVIASPGAPDFHSTAKWLVCESCGAYISADDRSGLLDHAMATLGAAHDVDDAATIVAMHAVFWTAYRGIRRYEPPTESR